MMERYDVGPRMSEMTVYNKVAYLSGQIPEDTSQDITGQTRQVLAEIDKLLALVASMCCAPKCSWPTSPTSTA